MVNQPKHIVGHAAVAWGHTRPLINLSARITKLRSNVYVTLLTNNAFYDRVKHELARSFDSLDEESAQRIRVISIGHVDKLHQRPEDKEFENAWKPIVAGESIVCALTGTRFPALPTPDAVIIDLFPLSEIATIQASSKTVKVVGWMSGMTYTGVHMFGPEKLGGKGNLRMKIEEESRRSGRPYEEVALELSYITTDDILRLPDFPPLYEYEQHTQDFPIPPDIGIHIIPRIYEVLQSMDSLFLTSPEPYEPESTAAMKEWFSESGRNVYLCGPILPSTSNEAAIANEMKQSPKSAEILAFLEATLQTSGPKSLLYISLGSLFWPVKTPEKMWAFLDVVMELQIPFILSHASTFATIPEDLQEKVRAYGKGILSPWTPQQLVLNHSATGWFVTHGGHNSLIETIAAGVPTIFWPFGADQPLNAILCTDKHKIAYELLEVRTGHGLKTIYRTGFKPTGTLDALREEAQDVLRKAFGEDGKAKRERVQALQNAVLNEWAEGGASKRDVLAFLDSL